MCLARKKNREKYEDQSNRIVGRSNNKYRVLNFNFVVVMVQEKENQDENVATCGNTNYKFLQIQYN